MLPDASEVRSELSLSYIHTTATTTIAEESENPWPLSGGTAKPREKDFHPENKTVPADHLSASRTNHWCYTDATNCSIGCTNEGFRQELFNAPHREKDKSCTICIKYSGI